MLFQKRQDFLAPVTGVVLGQVITKELTRDFHIESVLVKVTATSSANIATATADGLLGLVKNITISVSDGSRTRNVVNCSGRGILEYAVEAFGTLDRQTLAAKDITATGTTVFQITYPVFFALPQVDDPVGSVMLLPAPRYNSNPVIQITMAQQADLDSNATPTSAFSAITVDVIVNRRQVNIVDFPVVDTELAEASVAYSASLTNQLYELQVPGSYTGILLRAYTSATARGDISTTGGEFKLQLLGNVIRRFRLTDIEIENDLSIFPYAPTGAGSYFLGQYYLDFLTDKVGAGGGAVAELGSVLDANVTAGLGARLQLLQDIAGGSNVTMKYLTHRVFGDLRALKLGGGKGKK